MAVLLSEMSCPTNNSLNCSNASNFNGTSGFNTTKQAPVTPQHNELKRILMISFYAVILVLSVFGNSSIIAVLLRYQRMRTTANYLILNMAISDLLTAVVVLPRMLDIHITLSWAYKLHNFTLVTILCKTHEFVRELSSAVSVLSIVGIGIDRFYAIVFPLREKPRLLSMKYLIPGIWVIASAAYSTAFYTYSITTHNGLYYCTYSWHPAPAVEAEKWFLVATCVTFVAAPLGVLIFLYTIIVIKMNSQKIPGATASSVVKTRLRTKRNVVKLSCVIIVSFFVCWVPYSTLLLFVAFKWDLQPPPSKDLYNIIYITQEVFTALTYASVAINPYICLVFSSNFKQCFKEMFCCKKPEPSSRLTGVVAVSASQCTTVTSYENISMSSLSLGHTSSLTSQGI